MDLNEMACECVDWIHLEKNRDHWRALVHKVLNLWVL
jgi:hypothetical protein